MIDGENKKLLETIHLIQIARSGDKNALDDLFRRYGDRLLAIIRMRLGRKLRARMESVDILQEAMAAGVRGIQYVDFASEGAFLHWMTKVCENRIRDLADHLQAQKRDVNRETPLEQMLPKTDTVFGPIAELCHKNTPSLVAVKRENVIMLEEAIDKLPVEQKEAIILVRYEGLSYAEAGKKLQRSSDAVRMLVARAIVSLGKTMSA